ncbi:MAG: NAD(+) diphosphatase [Pseudomonadota bacterium]
MDPLSTITFGRPIAALDRAAHLRPDAATLAARPDALAVAMIDGRIGVALDGAKRLARLPLSALNPVEAPVFLGLSNGAPLFAADLGAPDETTRAALLGPDGKFIDLRSISPELTAEEGEIAATARSLTTWHAKHRFCAVCGAPSIPVDGGWRRLCESCGAQHFPRTDPVVIMLVLREDHVLMGRQPGWPPGLHSLLAGYVEPGETPEHAVRREVMEESAVQVGRVRYLASQAWPYPSTLMMGYAAEALSWEITIDPLELESAQWVPRAEIAEAMAGDHPTLGAPRPDAIARSLIAAWLDGSADCP